MGNRSRKRDESAENTFKAMRLNCTVGPNKYSNPRATRSSILGFGGRSHPLEIRWQLQLSHALSRVLMVSVM